MGRRSGEHTARPRVLIVVDTSVWITHFRNRIDRKVQRLRHAFGQEVVIVGDVVLLEVLQGTQDDMQARKFERLLSSFSLTPMLDCDLAVRAAQNYRLLRQNGVTIRKTADLVIGTFCLEHGLPLLHDDRDFDHIERHLGLKVLQA